MKEIYESWEKFLHPETLRGNLVGLALFITTFEKFKSIVIEKPESFFSYGFNEDGFLIDEAYKSEVLAKHKSKLKASLLWFEKMGAINEKDIQTFDEIRKYRNKVVHEMMKYLSDVNYNLEPNHFENLIEILSKIEKWWIKEIELTTNAMIIDAVKESGCDPEDVVPMSIMGFQMMVEIALGKEPESESYYKGFKDMKPK